MTKKNAKRILRVVLAVGTIISLFFVPWILIKAWILPLPDTVKNNSMKGWAMASMGWLCM